MRTSAKNIGFFEIYGVSARTRGERVEPVRTVCGQGKRGQFFVVLCGRLLWTAPYDVFGLKKISQLPAFVFNNSASVSVTALSISCMKIQRGAAPYFPLPTPMLPKAMKTFLLYLVARTLRQNSCQRPWLYLPSCDHCIG